MAVVITLHLLSRRLIALSGSMLMTVGYNDNNSTENCVYVLNQQGNASEYRHSPAAGSLYPILSTSKG